MKHYVLPVLMLLGSVFSMAQTTLEKAHKQYELKAYKQAITSYEDYYKENTDNQEVLLRLGDSYRHLNRLNESQKWYKRALAQGALPPAHLFDYAQLLMESGEYDKAKKLFKKYSAQDPETGSYFVGKCDFALKTINDPAFYSVKREYLNTISADFGATFLGDKVIFSSSRTDIKRDFTPRSADWTGNPNNQLFIAELDKNGFLSQPTFFRNDLKNKYNEGPLSFNSEGSVVVFCRNNFVDGTRQIESSGVKMNLFIARVDETGDWLDEKAFPFNYEGYSTGYPHLTPDGNTLYFASDRPDGYGGYDLYISNFEEGTWTIPSNMGADINSKGNEISPYTDGNNLYFSSDWHPGLGGLDVFRATKKGEKYEVYYMGTGVNSPLDDYGFIFKEKENTGYLTSNREGAFSHEDLYKVTAIAKLVELKFVDEANNPLTGVELDFSACGEGSFETNADGTATLRMFDPEKCIALAKKVGFESKSFAIKPVAGKVNIIMTPLLDGYGGLVMDAGNQKPLEGVKISAMDETSSKKLQTLSNASGKYKLDLVPGQQYSIVYSKIGYQDQSAVLEAPSAETDLMSVKLIASVTNLEDETTLPAISSSSSTEISKAYAVQVGAIFDKDKLVMSNYSNLADLGYVYAREEGNSKKIRVGIYAERAEAERIKEEVIRLGYTTAFVTEEESDNLMNRIMTTMNSKRKELANKPEATEIKEVKDTGVNANAMTKKPGKYKIRLATYQNTKWFDPDKVKHIGPIRAIPYKNGMTIMIVDGFDDLSIALKAKMEARKAGFTTAKVAIEKDGNLIRVE